MHANTVESPTPIRLILGIAVLVVLAVLLSAGISSWRDLAATRERERELRTEIEETRRALEILERRLTALENDPEALEGLAREDLWMARPDEVVIVLPDAEVDESPGAAP